MGFYPDIRDCYWSSDFFVQPTFYDPCSLVVLEALACGLPVITTAQNGAGELMSNGRQGYVLSAPEPQAELIALSDHDYRWYEDKLASLRAAIGDAGLAYSDARRVDRDRRP